MHFEIPAQDWPDGRMIIDSHLKWMAKHMRITGVRLPEFGSTRVQAGTEVNHNFHYLYADLKKFYTPPVDLRIKSMERQEGKGWAVWLVNMEPASSHELPFTVWRVIIKIDNDTQAVMCKLANCHAN